MVLVLVLIFESMREAILETRVQNSLIFGLNEGQQDKMGNLQKKIEQITQMGKEPIIAVIERRGEVIYYKINKINFNMNNSRLDNSFNL